MKQTKSPPDRMASLTHLRLNHVNTPDFGLVNDLAVRHRHQDFCVVWYSYSRSERMRLGEANDRFPKNYAVMFHGVPGASYRVVHIGENAYWTLHTNAYSWNSTGTGCVETYIKTLYHQYHPTIRLPWFSVDYAFVATNNPKESDLVAIDFTRQPGVRGGVITKYVDRKRAASLFKKARRYFEESPC